MEFYITSDIFDRNILEFILNNDKAEIYHHPAWLNAVSEATKSKGHYLLIKQDNKLIGLVPFVIKNNIFNSLPFTTHCLPLFTKKFDLSLLSTQIKKLFPKITGFKFYFRDDIFPESKSFRSNYLNHIIYLPENLDEYYNSLHSHSIRRRIRKAYDNNLMLRFGKSENDLNIFYELECKLRKSLGLPPAPYKFFLSIWKNLIKDNLILLPLVEYNSIPIAASMILVFKNIIYFEYTAIDKKFIKLYPNHFLQWEIIKKAHSEYGIKIVDFGRTDKHQIGLINFKENWNAQRINLIKFSDQKDRNLKSSWYFKAFKDINKLLPIWFLKLEGQILYNKFDKE